MGTNTKDKCFCTVFILIFESSVGAVMRAPAFYQCGPGSIPVRCHVCVEFVVGSWLTPRVFLRVFLFSILHNNQHLQIPNFSNDTIEIAGCHGTFSASRLWLCVLYMRAHVSVSCFFNRHAILLNKTLQLFTLFTVLVQLHHLK